MFISQDTDDFKLFLRSCGGKVESNLQILLLAVHPVSTFWVFFLTLYFTKTVKRQIFKKTRGEDIK